MKYRYFKRTTKNYHNGKILIDYYRWDGRLMAFKQPDGKWEHNTYYFKHPDDIHKSLLSLSCMEITELSEEDFVLEML